MINYKTLKKVVITYDELCESKLVENTESGNRIRIHCPICERRLYETDTAGIKGTIFIYCKGCHVEFEVKHLKKNYQR